MAKVLAIVHVYVGNAA